MFNAGEFALLAYPIIQADVQRRRSPMKRFSSLALCVLILGVLLLTGCPGNTGGPTGPATPNLSDVSTSAAAVHRGELLIFFIGFVDLSGDLNGGAAVVTDDQNYRYENLSVSNAAGTSGTLTITITVNNLLTPNKAHLFTIVVFDRASNQSNTVYATVNIL